MPLKPRALVICQPFEARIGYFLAGLSHFYQLEIFFRPNKPFRKANQAFFPWLYAADVKFTLLEDSEDVFRTDEKYDAVFLHAEVFGLFSKKNLILKNKQEVFNYLKRLREKTKKLFFMELAEFYFFNFTSREFWDMIDGCIRCYMFKKEYAYLVRQEAHSPKHLKYHGGPYEGDNDLFELNANFMVEDYYHKIIVLPFPGSIVDHPSSIKPLAERPYDIAANFRSDQITRVAVAKATEEWTGGKNIIYSMDYGDSYSSNRRTVKNLLFATIVRWYGAERLLAKLFYGKYPYVKLAYVHNLVNSRCILGMGLKNRSLRNVDCWSHGAVLLDWNYDKMDSGLPMVDGYNYFSIGVREEIFPDNEHFGEGQKQKVLARIGEILSDSQKQQDIVNNQLKVYNEYYSSAKNFVSKVFIEKAVPELLSNNI